MKTLTVLLLLLNLILSIITLNFMYKVSRVSIPEIAVEQLQPLDTSYESYEDYVLATTED